MQRGETLPSNRVAIIAYDEPLLNDAGLVLQRRAVQWQAASERQPGSRQRRSSIPYALTGRRDYARTY